MGTRRLAVVAAGGIVLALAFAIARPWELVRETQSTEAGPRRYRFQVDYTAADIRGQVTHRQRVQATYTRGLPGREVVWSDVSVAEAPGASAPLGRPRKPAFMQGLRYRQGPTTMTEMLQPGFFKDAPPTAIVERNLVWDVEALEMFARALFEHLEPNQSHQLLSSQRVDIPGIGTFQNRDVQLTLTGRSQRNGQDCAVIDYSAYFNPLVVANQGMTLTGRSHYWGQIWVAVATGQIERATLFEDVLGEMLLAGQDAQIIDVFRSGVLESLAQR